MWLVWGRVSPAVPVRGLDIPAGMPYPEADAPFYGGGGSWLAGLETLFTLALGI